MAVIVNKGAQPRRFNFGKKGAKIVQLTIPAQKAVQIDDELFEKLKGNAIFKALCETRAPSGGYILEHGENSKSAVESATKSTAKAPAKEPAKGKKA